MKKILFALAISTSMAGSAAMADAGVHVGNLTCQLTGVKNDIVYTKEEFDCSYKKTSGDIEQYVGQMKNIGLNLSVTKDLTLIWSVLAPSRDTASTQALKGKYVGGSAAIALGAGAGANILIGGGGNSFTLQPISAEGVSGTGASLNISEFSLK